MTPKSSEVEDSIIKSLDEVIPMLDPSLVAASTCVLIIGSHAEHLSTIKSDVDIMILVDDCERLAQTVARPQARTSDGKSVDPIVVSVAQFENLLARSKTPDLNGLETRQIEFVHKAANGIPLKGGERYKELVETFFDQNVFMANFINRYTNVAVNTFDNVLGEVEEGRWLSAAEFARSMVRSCIDALLAAYGDTYAKPKWRILRAQRILGFESTALERFLNVEFNVPYRDLGKMSSWIEETLNFVRQLQLLTFFPEARQGHDQMHSRPLTGQCFMTHPWIILSRKDNSFYVKSRSGQFAVDKVMALILMSLSQPNDVWGVHSVVASVLNSSRTIPIEGIKQRLGKLEAMELISMVLQ